MLARALAGLPQKLCARSLAAAASAGRCSQISQALAPASSAFAPARLEPGQQLARTVFTAARPVPGAPAAPQQRLQFARSGMPAVWPSLRAQMESSTPAPALSQLQAANRLIKCVAHKFPSLPR